MYGNHAGIVFGGVLCQIDRLRFSGNLPFLHHFGDGVSQRPSPALYLRDIGLQSGQRQQLRDEMGCPIDALDELLDGLGALAGQRAAL